MRQLAVLGLLVVVGLAVAQDKSAKTPAKATPAAAEATPAAADAVEGRTRGNSGNKGNKKATANARFLGGGFNPGGFNQGGFNQGGLHPGGVNHGGFHQGGFNQGGFNQGGFNQGGFHQGGFNQGGFNQGGFNQGGLHQGGFNQGGFNQGGFNQGLGLGGVNPGFGGINPGLGGIGGQPISGNCRHWCRTPQGQLYCCEKGTDPVSNVNVLKPGNCPPVRPICPPTRSFTLGPKSCSNDGACGGIDKCCFDTCGKEHLCKTPLNLHQPIFG